MSKTTGISNGKRLFYDKKILSETGFCRIKISWPHCLQFKYVPILTAFNENLVTVTKYYLENTRPQGRMWWQSTSHFPLLVFWIVSSRKPVALIKKRQLDTRMWQEYVILKRIFIYHINHIGVTLDRLREKLSISGRQFNWKLIRTCHSSSAFQLSNCFLSQIDFSKQYWMLLRW